MRAMAAVMLDSFVATGTKEGFATVAGEGSRTASTEATSSLS